ncbi:iron-sulfur cluster assembly 1 homolog, mitochondrial isoform X2 [Mustela erminea]|uniref:iron-sulfur cluster assembly 1 homolog, mitochondrial isoform X2 n=1 Tax=Mustela erminea TaxID=36723 RepID=UPI001386694F|nr:iron-sulfur cluster assembly 1 homolog, mitochondrial isoform X2 [Mustela erminea]
MKRREHARLMGCHCWREQSLFQTPGSHLCHQNIQRQKEILMKKLFKMEESFLRPVIFMKIPASTSVIPGSYVTASFPAHEQKKKMATLHSSQSVHRKESTANTFRNRNGLC